MKRFFLLSLLAIILFQVMTGASLCAKQSPVEIFFFYSPHCKVCLVVKNEFLLDVEQRYGEKVNFKLLNTEDERV